MDGISTIRRKYIDRHTLSYFVFPILFVLVVLAMPRSATAVNAPSALTATAVSSSQINLVWADNSTDETGFLIERDQRNDGVFVQIAAVGANIRTYSNAGLSDGSVYNYRVRAYNGRGYSAYSNTATATTRTAYAINAPTNLNAVALSSTQVVLSWTDNSSNEAQFQIERATNRTGPYSLVGTVGSNVTSFTHIGLTAGAWYYYRVRAVNYSVYSAYTSDKIVALLTITSSAGAGGSIVPAGAVSVNLWDSKTFTITPASGYGIALVHVDGSPVGAVSSYTFSSISANHTITASFVDIAPPTGTIKINNGAAYAKATAVTLTLNATDLNGVTEMQFSNDAVTWSAPEPYAGTKSWNLLFGDGTKNVHVKYKDGIGNWSLPNAISAAIILDTTPPAIVITSPLAGPINDNTPLLAYTVSDGSVTVYVDNVLVAKTSGSSLNALPDGDHTVRVESVDTAGNKGTAQVAFTVDTIQPAISIAPVISPTDQSTQSITGTRESNVVVTITVDTAASVGPVSYPTSTSWSCTLGSLADSTNSITATAVDAAGNVGTAVTSINVYSIAFQSVSVSRNAINTFAAESTTIFFTINTSATTTVTLKIIPEKGGVPVYQASQTCPSAGAFMFTWDGHNDTGNVVPDEAYLFILEAVSGVKFGLYSPPAPTGTGTVTCSQSTGLDPAKNIPLTVTYTPAQPSRVNVVIDWGSQNFKILEAVPATPESHTFDWNGRNLNMQLLDIGAKASCSVASLLGENYVITTGDAVQISEVKTDPYMMHLSYGQFTKIKYILSRDANVTLKLTSPSGAVTTIFNNLTQTAGAHEIEWNGIDPADPAGRNVLATKEGDYIVSVQAVNPITGTSSTARANVRIGY